MGRSAVSYVQVPASLLPVESYALAKAKGSCEPVEVKESYNVELESYVLVVGLPASCPLAVYTLDCFPLAACDPESFPLEWARGFDSQESLETGSETDCTKVSVLAKVRL